MHGSINLPYLLDAAGEQHGRQGGTSLIELSPIAGDKQKMRKYEENISGGKGENVQFHKVKAKVRK